MNYELDRTNPNFDEAGEIPEAVITAWNVTPKGEEVER